MTSRVRGSLKPGEQDQRAEADVAVRVRFDGLEQRRHGDRRIGAPGRPRRGHAVAEVDGAELVDRRGELRRRDGVARIRAARLPRAGGGAGAGRRRVAWSARSGSPCT